MRVNNALDCIPDLLRLVYDVAGERPLWRLDGRAAYREPAEAGEDTGT